MDRGTFAGTIQKVSCNRHSVPWVEQEKVLLKLIRLARFFKVDQVTKDEDTFVRTSIHLVLAFEVN